MTKFEPVINLSVENLRERRSQLEKELNKVVVELVTVELKDSISKDFSVVGLDVARISWDFHPESDDEGGSDWWVTDVTAVDSSGDEVNIEDIVVEHSRWNENLRDLITETLSDYREDLYDQYITEINF